MNVDLLNLRNRITSPRKYLAMKKTSKTKTTQNILNVLARGILISLWLKHYHFLPTSQCCKQLKNIYSLPFLPCVILIT